MAALCWSSCEEIPHVQGKRKRSKMVNVARRHQRADTLNHNNKNLVNLNTQTTALSNSMKLSHAHGATRDERVVLERSDRMWYTGEGNGKPLQYPIILPFHTVHGVLKARILKWFAIPFSSVPHSVRSLHHDPPVLGCPTGMACFIELDKAVVLVLLD